MNNPVATYIRIAGIVLLTLHLIAGLFLISENEGVFAIAMMFKFGGIVWTCRTNRDVVASQQNFIIGKFARQGCDQLVKSATHGKHLFGCFFQALVIFRVVLFSFGQFSLFFHAATDETAIGLFQVIEFGKGIACYQLRRVTCIDAQDERVHGIIEKRLKKEKEWEE